MSLDVAVLDPPERTLARWLVEHAAGQNADLAAVDLLARHGIWLAQPSFRRYVHTGRCHATGRPIAYIRWRAALCALQADTLSCTGSEADILRIAAALGADVPIHLRRVLGGLDRNNITLVTQAITIANGS